MKTINITATTIDSIFNQLKDNFGGEFHRNIKERILKIDTPLAFGTIRGIRTKGGISYLEFKMNFNEDIKLTINSPIKKSINFAYCSEGKMAHAFDTAKNRIEIEPFQTAIVSNIEHEKNTLYFYRDVKLCATIISVNTLFGDSQKFTINNQLRDRFILNRIEDVHYIGSFNLKIAEQLNRIQAIRQKGLVRALLIEGLIHVILALELEQHKRDRLSHQNSTGTLTSGEMAKVKDLSEFINNYPETSLTVTDLSHKIALTPSKLQEGFKLMHNTTVNNYIRNVRIKKSEELLKTTDLNISQILYTLGFSSRSYFSKIFKEKYNCSPSTYKAQNKLAVSA